jgi:hypothetical protein
MTRPPVRMKYVNARFEGSPGASIEWFRVSYLRASFQKKGGDTFDGSVFETTRG